MDKIYSSETDIYEHGIMIENDEYLTSFKVIATAKLPIYSAFNLSILDSSGKSLNERAVHLVWINDAHCQADYYEEYDLRYCVLAMLYHLNQIINIYVRLTQMFEQVYPYGTALRGNTSDPRVFYEIDAFLGAARRIYESIRNVLWKHYHQGMTGKWSSIKKVLTSTNNTPIDFRLKLQESWNNFGENLTNYRDCVTHYIPLTDSNTTCWMELYEKHWGMNIKLPANPSSQSRKSFDFTSGPEALVYCHSVACHLIELSELLEAQKRIHLHLANPPR